MSFNNEILTCLFAEVTPINSDFLLAYLITLFVRI